MIGVAIGSDDAPADALEGCHWTPAASSAAGFCLPRIHTMWRLVGSTQEEKRL